MRVVTFQMPHYYGSAVGKSYIIDREEKLSCMIAACTWEYEAIPIVENLLIQQGSPLDHSRFYLSVYSENMAIDDEFFESTLVILRELGLSSKNLLGGEVEIYSVLVGRVNLKKAVIRSNLPLLNLDFLQSEDKEGKA